MFQRCLGCSDVLSIGVLAHLCILHISLHKNSDQSYMGLPVMIKVDIMPAAQDIVYFSQIVDLWIDQISIYPVR